MKFSPWILMLPAVTLRADQIIMKNGDRYSGRLETVEAGKVKFVAEYAGTISLPWDAVATLTSGDTFVVKMKNGGLESAPAERILAMRGEIEAVRSRAEQDRVRQRIEIAHTAAWSGNTDLGVSLSRGNAEATALSGAVNATRATVKTKLGLYGAALYSRVDREGERITAANLRRGGLRYDLNLNPKQFAFVSADVDHNPIQSLSLRTVLGTGFGRHVIQTNLNTFDIYAGGTLNREQFTTGEKRLAGEALLSESSTHKLNGTFSLSQKFAMYPNLTATGAYRMTLDSSAVTALKRWLSWQVTVSNRYISNPPPGARPNDLLVTTGFRVNFGTQPQTTK